MSNRKENNKRVAKNTIFLYIRMVIVMFITLFTTRELLSALGIVDYGVYNVICGFVSMFTFLNTSMANGTQRFYNYEIGKNGEQGIAKVFSHAVLIQLVLSVLLIIVVEIVGLWYLNNKMVIPDGRLIAASWIFQLSLINLFIVVNTVPYNAAIMAYECMDYYAFLGILDAVLKLAIVFAIPYAHIDHLIFYGLLMTGISLINYILNSCYCRIRFKSLRFTRALNRLQFQSMLSFSGWNIFGTVSHMMQNQGVNLILNAFWGTVVNAANGIAHQMNGAVNFLTAGFLTAVRPQMIKSYARGDFDYLKKMYYSTSKVTFFFVMIIAVPLIGEVDVILDFWLGKGKYPELTPIFAQLTMFMTLCNSYATPTSIIVHATGKMKKFQIIVSIVTLMIIPIAYMAARLGCEPYMIIFFSAMVTIATQITRLIVIRGLVNYSVIDYCKKVFLPTWSVLAISIAFTFVINIFISENVVLSFVKIIVCILFSSCLIFLIGLNTPEKQLIKSLINKKH